MTAPSKSAPIKVFRTVAAVDAGNEAISLTALPPLSIYIHIPWCLKKCPYCDFNSHEAKTSIDESAYIDCLIADLDHALPKIWGRRVYSIFFGGGTPSLFSAASIDRLLAAIRARVTVDSEAEITLEANPGTFEAEKFRGFRDAGVNRLSIGVQSFQSRYLAALGRVHNGDEALRAIEMARPLFDEINLDVMFALPNQSMADCQSDLRTAISLGTTHLSFYHLTLEPNTLFHRFPPALPDDDLAADMQDVVIDELVAAGYGHYETSAYAKPGHECRHNLNYWRFGDYLGLGAGAHGKLSFPDRITREVRFKQPKSYMEQARQGLSLQEEKSVRTAELPFEFMLNALRLTAGVPTTLFSERTGLSTSQIAGELRQGVERGLMESSPLVIQPTLKGQRFLNDLLTLFLPEDSQGR